MADVVTLYGDISPRTAGYAWKDLLKRIVPGHVTAYSAQTKPVPKGVSKVVKFRRYLPLAYATTPLAEGVTPDGKKLTYEDILVVLQQYGDYVVLTDVIEDTHEDPVFTESRTILAEQVQNTVESINIGIITNGTNAYFANGTQRSNVNTPVSRGLLRLAVRFMKAQNTKFFTMALKGSPDFATQPIESAFIAYGHTDLEADIRNMPGFIPVASYAKPESAWEYEVGTVENCRFILTSMFTPWTDVGGAKGAMLSTSGTYADVYPIQIIGKDFWAVTPLRGASSGQPIVVNPKPSAGDPLGQRGFVGWKLWHEGIILQQAYGVRLEVSATATPN